MIIWAEEFIFCLILETVQYVTSNMGNMKNTMGEELSIFELVKVAFSIDEEEILGEKESKFRKPLTKAIFCTSLQVLRHEMQIRRNQRLENQKKPKQKRRQLRRLS